MKACQGIEDSIDWTLSSNIVELHQLRDNWYLRNNKHQNFGEQNNAQ